MVIHTLNVSCVWCGSENFDVNFYNVLSVAGNQYRDNSGDCRIKGCPLGGDCVQQGNGFVCRQGKSFLFADRIDFNNGKFEFFFNFYLKMPSIFFIRITFLLLLFLKTFCLKHKTQD